MEKKNKKNIFISFLTNIYVKNILLMAIIFVALVFVVLLALDSYTKHDEAIEVPLVKGLQADEAINILKSNGLRFDTIVSDAQTNVAPGAVFDQIPKGKSNVKKGHIIYLMVHSRDGQLISIPSLNDLSRRQGEAQLNARGFTRITIQEEPSPYKDIILSVLYRGKEITTGQKIPKGAPLTLVVGSGNEETASDSAEVEVDKSFF